MNFLSHAIPYLTSPHFDSPLLAISTGIPDWLTVVDRKIRARGKLAEQHVNSTDSELSDVAKGGETVFPRFGGAPQPRDFKRCDVGLKAKPEKGKVIIFYDLLPNGQMDDLSLHGGCPVEEGVKWAANKWVWNAPMQYVSSLDSSLGGTFRLK